VSRLTELVERPLDPAVGRVVLVLAGAVWVGFAALVGLGLIGPGATAPTRMVVRHPAPDRAAAQLAVPSSRPADAEPSVPRGRQDPQDRRGSAAHRRARRELATHRALQHVPWHREGASISLVGARRGKAVLEIRGPGLRADRRAWSSFLRRFDDDGRSYLRRLVVGGRAHDDTSGRARR
jgi:hypothetical protein